MLMVFRSPFETRKASDYLTDETVAHRVVLIPADWEYRPEDVAIFIESDDNMDIPMRLSRQRLVVMRVFRDVDRSEFETAPVIARSGHLSEEGDAS